MSGEAEKRPIEFKFVDGLRAIAAVSVALFHAYLFTGHNGDTARDLPSVFKVFEFGDFAVPVFIVLSGFVLMIPVARTAGLEFRNGVKGYLFRRAKRILPPYYIALLLSLALIYLIPLMNRPQDTAWDSKIPVTPWGLISHLLVIHNLNPGWIYQINGPAWSVATEWQLYFALPFLLLPVWRRFGNLAALLVALSVGVGLSFVPGFNGAHFWFLGLFAMGGLAARFVNAGAWPRRLGLITGAVWAVFLGLEVFVNPKPMIAETVLGSAIALLLMWLSKTKLAGGSGWLLRVLESKFLVWVGLWSYSLYLIHSPVLALGNLLFLDVAMPTAVRFAIEVGLVLPVAAACGYLFHLLVERRFMTSHQRSAEGRGVSSGRGRRSRARIGA